MDFVLPIISIASLRMVSVGDGIFYTQVVDNVCLLIYNNIISKNTILLEVYLFYR